MMQPKTPSRTGKRIAIALVIVWVAIIVGLYAVLAKLKMGGAEALRSGPAPHESQPALQRKHWIGTLVVPTPDEQRLIETVDASLHDPEWFHIEPASTTGYCECRIGATMFQRVRHTTSLLILDGNASIIGSRLVMPDWSDRGNVDPDFSVFPLQSKHRGPCAPGEVFTIALVRGRNPDAAPDIGSQSATEVLAIWEVPGCDQSELRRTE